MEPLTSKEKLALAAQYAVVDAINSSHTDVPLPEEYADAAGPVEDARE
jgi:hypothetical protein